MSSIVVIASSAVASIEVAAPVELLALLSRITKSSVPSVNPSSTVPSVIDSAAIGLPSLVKVNVVPSQAKLPGPA